MTNETKDKFTNKTVDIVCNMLLIAYLIMIPVSYPISKSVVQKVNPNKWTQSDRAAAVVLSVVWPVTLLIKLGDWMEKTEASW